MACDGGLGSQLTWRRQARLHAVEYVLRRGAAETGQPGALQRVVVFNGSGRGCVRDLRAPGIAQGQRQGLLAFVVGVTETIFCLSPALKVRVPSVAV